MSIHRAKSSNTGVTVAVTVCGDGRILRPMIVFKGSRSRSGLIRRTLDQLERLSTPSICDVRRKLRRFFKATDDNFGLRRNSPNFCGAIRYFDSEH
jgi:hypothetical protein